MMAEEKKWAAVEQNGNKKERKVYDLPGQKRNPPEERDSLRIFYETLYQRLPDSEMAAFWMMESGLLPLEEAKKVYKKKQKRKQEQKLGSVKRRVDSVKVVEKAKARDPSSPPASAKKKSVEKLKNVSSVWKKSSKRKSRDDDSATSENEVDDDFVLVKKKKKKSKA
ncbi:uncharacterized protein LOC122658961 [Telopea speciosissima]|uniref:uncharacterized protein LOC122658961 n=1 Tax=Telopea speciosissima TaxID=54955 RepID=UPI001CC54380|nr:uncharacterized protein LOC122658961 [Telopea speciosissima]